MESNFDDLPPATQTIVTLHSKVEELEDDLDEAKSRIYAAERRADTVSALTRSYAEDRLAGYDALASHDWDTLVAWHEDNGQTLTNNVLNKLSEMAQEQFDIGIKTEKLEKKLELYELIEEHKLHPARTNLPVLWAVIDWMEEETYMAPTLLEALAKFKESLSGK